VVEEQAGIEIIRQVHQQPRDVIGATLSVLEIPANRLVLKTRERQKGKNQYQKPTQSA
jgi:23S rRNA (guanine2445-N2)-methyltransferase / 23S rRNA (guanine2069-N7)-methyltransferase